MDPVAASTFTRLTHPEAPANAKTFASPPLTTLVLVLRPKSKYLAKQRSVVSLLPASQAA